MHTLTKVDHAYCSLLILVVKFRSAFTKYIVSKASGSHRDGNAWVRLVVSGETCMHVDDTCTCMHQHRWADHLSPQGIPRQLSNPRSYRVPNRKVCPPNSQFVVKLIRAKNLYK